MMRALILVLLLLVPLHADLAQASIVPERGKLFSAGRYVELEKLMEKEIGDDPNPKSAKLMFQCAAYGKLKRYNKLFPCLAKLEDNVNKGDISIIDMEEMARDSPFLAGMARFGAGMAGQQKELEGSVVPYLHLMRSEAYNELRDYPKAMAAARAATDSIVVGSNGERALRIMTLTSHGLAEGFGGNREAALKIAADLTAVDTSGNYSLLAPEKWLGVARIYVSVGEYAKANEALRKDEKSLFDAFAVGVADAVAGMDAGESLFSYLELPKEFMLYKTQLEIGQVKEAKEGFDKLLKDKRSAGNGEIYWLLLFDRGRIAAGEGDMAEAVRLWRQAVEIIEQQRSSINTEANKIGFAGDKQAVYHHLIGGLFATGQFTEAFDYLERSKSRALVDILASKKDFAVATGDTEKIRELLAQAEKTEIASLVQGAEKRSTTRSIIAPTEILRQQAPELATLVSVSTTPLADIQAKLRPDETLVEYYYDSQWLYAFVLNRDSLRVVRTQTGELEAEVRAWRTALEEPEGKTQLPHAQTLYKKLVTPIAAFLDRPRLTFVSHGVLHYVPLAALHSGSEYLIDKFAVRLLPSASVMKYLRVGDTQYAGGALTLGNPDLGDPRLDLEFAQQEAVAIAKMVPQSRAFLRKEANETTLRTYGQGFRYLHFATHGEFKADNPLDSALFLSKEAQGDGLLTVNKLYSMRLDTDLVTLSACETGLGKIANGDDVVGLTRGFLYAGAATIVASLWKVDDQATSDLMRAFYTNLGRTGKLDALRQAQLDIKRKYPPPYFWAPFQLLGNPDGGQYVAAKAPEPARPAAKGKTDASRKAKR
ncbi:MAG: CHAT domain-containing protein [Sulfuritalea sp.]|nr:CHAT domain-containing protein [Sulfuritalea sp.]